MEMKSARAIYTEYGVTRAILRTLAEDGRIHSTSILSPDGVNRMYFYSVDDLKRILEGDVDGEQQ